MAQRKINASAIAAPVIWRDSERMSGTPCFAGTRVPVKTLFDYLQDDGAIAEFLDNFPTVEKEQVFALLAQIGQELNASEDGHIHIS